MVDQSIQTVSSTSEKAKVYTSLILVLVSIVAFSFLERDLWLRWALLVVGFGLAAVIYFLSDSSKRFFSLLRDSWRELQKVVWPSRKEAVYFTLYIFVFVFVIALILWLADKTLEWVLYDLLLGWRG